MKKQLWKVILVVLAIVTVLRSIQNKPAVNAPVLEPDDPHDVPLVNANSIRFLLNGLVYI